MVGMVAKGDSAVVVPEGLEWTGSVESRGWDRGRIHEEDRLDGKQDLLWGWTEEDGLRTLMMMDIGKELRDGQRRWSAFTRRVQAL